MRISDWSSDVCSSDLAEAVEGQAGGGGHEAVQVGVDVLQHREVPADHVHAVGLGPVDQVELALVLHDVGAGGAVAGLEVQGLHAGRGHGVDLVEAHARGAGRLLDGTVVAVAPSPQAPVGPQAPGTHAG